MTSQVGGYTGFSDVIKRLDFKSALHDARRFNYVCKLLELLINESVMSLSGTAQKVVFSLLEELAHTGEGRGNVYIFIFYVVFQFYINDFTYVGLRPFGQG